MTVNNAEEGYEYTWSRSKFQDRLDIMREIMNMFYEDGEVDISEKEADPFWDPPEAQRIGKAYYILKPLAHLVEDAEIWLFDEEPGLRPELALVFRRIGENRVVPWRASVGALDLRSPSVTQILDDAALSNRGVLLIKAWASRM